MGMGVLVISGRDPLKWQKPRLAHATMLTPLHSSCMLKHISIYQLAMCLACSTTQDPHPAKAFLYTLDDMY